MSKDLETKKKEEEQSWWRNKRNRDVYSLFTDGKSIDEITEILGARSCSDIERVITHEYFMRRLENHLHGVNFAYKVNQVLATENVFQLLWNRVRDNIEEISPEVCLRELSKFLPTNKKEIIAKIFMSENKEAPKENSDFYEADLGYEGLEDSDKAEYPELETDEESEQPGDPEVDPAEQTENEQESADRV